MKFMQNIIEGVPTSGVSLSEVFRFVRIVEYYTAAMSKR